MKLKKWLALLGACLLLALCLPLNVAGAALADETKLTYGPSGGEMMTGIRVAGCDHNDTGTLVIPATVDGVPVTTIGAGAFQFSSYSAIILPDTVTVIEDSAFAGCKATVIALGDNVAYIGNNAFSRCDNLTAVTIPAGVKVMGDNAFAACRSLHTVTVEEGVLTIGKGAFSDCTALTDVTLPTSLMTVEEDAFAGSTALDKLHYDGSAGEWRAISIGDGNKALTRTKTKSSPLTWILVMVGAVALLGILLVLLVLLLITFVVRRIRNWDLP